MWKQPYLEIHKVGHCSSGAVLGSAKPKQTDVAPGRFFVGVVLRDLCVEQNPPPSKPGVWCVVVETSPMLGPHD